ncbi:MAG: type II toxin-antitoxin system HicA family toxin [Actinomycetota bacterium]
MSRLPRTSGKRVLRALQQAGFEQTHVRGSHHYLRKAGKEALVVVPVHGNRDLPLGTLRAILRQAELTPEELTELL